MVKSEGRKRLGLPLVALGLDFMPVVFILLGMLVPDFMFISFFILGVIFTPIAGIIVGIIALCQGRKVIGKVGMGIAITAIGLPIGFVTTVVLLIETGAVAIGM